MSEEKVILLIEDNPSDAALTKRALEKKKNHDKIVVAEDGEIALNYLFGIAGNHKQIPAKLPTVIFLDLKLPKISGIEVLQRIRSDPRTKRIPVVVLTSSLEDIDLIASYDLGANSYVRKPVDYAGFADTIASIGMYWLTLNESPPK